MNNEKFEAAKSWPAGYIIEKNLTVDNWPETYLLGVAAKRKKDSVIGLLIDQLENATITKLRLTSRLIVWERIISKDILFEGKGLQVDDDLFSVAGRANWLLRSLTQKNFGYVTPGSTPSQLRELKSKWKKWLNNENPEEYQTPFPTKEKGLDEIHSLIAFEAIIRSLEPSAQKDKLTSDCLHNLYNLSELPKDRDGPGALCSPDNWAYIYLASLSGIKDTHDYNWWMAWWDKNKQKLFWNAEKASFDLKG